MRVKSGIPKNLHALHSWFAWRPVKTQCGTWVWLERVNRQLMGFYAGGCWHYWLRESFKESERE
jgi:hypothetical protein